MLSFLERLQIEIPPYNLLFLLCTALGICKIKKNFC